MKFRELNADEIECRVATVSAKGCSLLLYKDARADMNLLDETVGAMNWQRSHEVIDGRLYCTLSIWDEVKKMWISKQDVGTESYTEKEKGQASDSFKRAAFNFGIGRALYTAPFIWINETDANVQTSNGKFTTRERFEVSEIAYTDGVITRLVIVNAKNHRPVYTFGKSEEKKAEEHYEEVKKMTIDATKVKVLNNKAAENNIDPAFLANMCGKKTVDELTEAQFNNIINNWGKVLDKWSAKES